MFGKPLVSQAVVRAKLAGMIIRVESLQNWLENLTYQMDHMSYKEQSDKLAGQIAFLKTYATQSAQKTATDAVQIFGGRGITRTGLGRTIEHVSHFFTFALHPNEIYDWQYHRVVPFDAVLGGGM